MDRCCVFAVIGTDNNPDRSTLYAHYTRRPDFGTATDCPPHTEFTTITNRVRVRHSNTRTRRRTVGRRFRSGTAATICASRPDPISSFWHRLEPDSSRAPRVLRTESILPRSPPRSESLTNTAVSDKTNVWGLAFVSHMVDIDPSPTRTGLKIAVVAATLIMATLAVAPVVVPSDEVTVSDRGPNSVVVDNAGDTPVTAHIESGLFTYNATVDAGETTIIPTDDADDVTIITEASQ